MIIEIELKLKTLTFVVFDPVASFHPLSCLGFFLIFHFLARHCGSKPQPMSASQPIENLNFKGMLALPLTPYLSIKGLTEQPYAACERATARGRAQVLGSNGI